MKKDNAGGDCQSSIFLVSHDVSQVARADFHIRSALNRELDKGTAIGSENEKSLILRALNSADKIIAAWGENCIIHQRHKEIEHLIEGYDIN
jgi:hypothetical protein